MKVLHTQWVMHTHPAWLGSKSVSTSVALRQRVQQRLCLLQVDGVKALGEPAADRGEQVIGFRTLPLLLPEAGPTPRRPPRPGVGPVGGVGRPRGAGKDCGPARRP